MSCTANMATIFIHNNYPDSMADNFEPFTSGWPPIHIADLAWITFANLKISWRDWQQNSRINDFDHTSDSFCNKIQKKWNFNKGNNNNIIEKIPAIFNYTLVTRRPLCIRYQLEYVTSANFKISSRPPTKFKTSDFFLVG